MARKPLTTARQRRSRIAYIKAKGDAATTAELAELASLETERQQRAAGLYEPPVADPGPEAADEPSVDDPVADPPPEPPPTPPPPPKSPPIDPAPPPPPPPPPRTATFSAPERESPRRGESADWRDKWRAKDAGSGREATCVELADKWLDGLRALDAQCVLAGLEPLTWLDQIKPALVLTVDRVLPERIKLTPEIKAAVATTTVVVRRFAKRKEIAAALKDRDERAKHQAWREQRVQPKPPKEPITVTNENEPKPETKPEPQSDAPTAPIKAPESKPTTPESESTDGVNKLRRMPKDLDVNDPSVVF